LNSYPFGILAVLARQCYGKAKIENTREWRFAILF
jgi:hypothetical protein